MKFCVDCRHYRKGGEYFSGDCYHAMVFTVNLVTGKSSPGCCKALRDGCHIKFPKHHPCGTEAILFEPK